VIDKRRLAENLTDAMVRLLHFQEKGEPDWQNLNYAEARDLCETVPQSLIDRYRNEVLFHNQVQRAVSTIMQLVQEAEKATDQPSDVSLLAAEINTLPLRVREFIHDLEARADPAGDVRRAIVAEETAAALAARIEEMEGRSIEAWLRPSQRSCNWCKKPRSAA
jgi:RecG-like helicase